ncbi:FAD/NAD(P)-binding oxidoreductase [Amycolatopsis sp. Poz14]|uniref:NAD(P)/FAD-dependent oxidoreductase n=1 Tax=Amycolatopsis sp. Poz14 TaxID=1447705 RepID=UPI001EE7FD2F|nr:FAD/NAD(P)-binding oxidoreductase [Amycolatopsis sp. Poz14]MCG3753972.1 NAD(P)/FAD-dependent oxidoreductase [Amycolatopsis sp. Poz14]
MRDYDVVIVGAGEAGTATALGLAGRGFSGTVCVLGEEPGPSYHRPPLSKGFLDGSEDAGSIVHATAEHFRDAGAEAWFGVRAWGIDRAARVVSTAAGEVRYGHLVLATGARNRSVSSRPIDGVVQLRTVAEAEELRGRLAETDRIVIVGAGVLGLEVASVAAGLGVSVEVVEAADGPLGGKVSPATAQAVEGFLRSEGIRFSYGSGVARFRESDGKLSGVELSDGRVVETRLALVCVGVVPDTSLAVAAGLKTGAGIEVDEHLVTSDPNVSAIGDSASYPDASGARVRTESIANALSQGSCVAARLCGGPAEYSAIPWFWSAYGKHRLDIVGSEPHVDEVIVQGDPLAQDFAAFCFAGGRLARFESVGRPRHSMRARRLFERGQVLTPAEVRAPGFDLAAWRPAVPTA